MRSYSLSGEPSAERYRVSVKRESHGAASVYVDDELKIGDIVKQARRAAVSRYGRERRLLFC